MSTENSTPNPTNSGWNVSHILKTLLLWGLFAAVGAAIAVTIAVVIAWRQLPSIDALKDYKPRMAMQIYSADGEMIGEFGEERRKPVNINEVPDKCGSYSVRESRLWSDFSRFFSPSRLRKTYACRCVHSSKRSFLPIAG